MPWRESLRPVRMQRVALLAPADAVRDLLVDVADEGAVQLDDVTDDGPRDLPPAAARLQRLRTAEEPVPALTRAAPDLDGWEAAGRVDLIAGEAQLEQRSAQALTRGNVAALLGWMPADDLTRLADRVAGVGGAVVPMPSPAGAQPPTLLPQQGAAREFAPLTEMYTAVPYADVNPSLLAGLAYVVMFGMMFADVGHGALLVLAAVAVRLQWSRRLSRLRPVWLFVAGAGAASIVFGALYGEFFGPTGVVPVVWLAPLEHPVPLLGAAVAVGALLLAGAYVLGTVNRFREGGWRVAVYAPSGLAGVAVFLGLAAVAGGLYADLAWLLTVGAAITVTGLVVAYTGLLVAAGGGPAGATQAAIELFDLVVRLGSNVVSFARLAAFGLTHAALGAVVWQATIALWPHGPLGVLGAAATFAVGNTVAFALEALVAGIQALRLEYYELFSRVFAGEGRPFRPWHVPLSTEAPC
jgi:V/A-type H+-transporting ATPase subunit I